jgi:hypothetical protein
MNLDIAVAILTFTNPQTVHGFSTALKLMGRTYLFFAFVLKLIALKNLNAISFEQVQL